MVSMLVLLLCVPTFAQHMEVQDQLQRFIQALVSGCNMLTPTDAYIHSCIHMQRHTCLQLHKDSYCYGFVCLLTASGSVLASLCGMVDHIACTRSLR